MSVHQRAYAGPDDLTAMKRVLIEGRRVSPHSGFIHVGDLDWWHSYLLRNYPFEEHATLWEMDGAVVGWSLVSPGYGAFDLFALPGVRDSAAMDEMLARTEQRTADLTRQQGRESICTMWVFADDRAWQARFSARGFERDPAYSLSYYVHPLSSIPDVPLPDGFKLRATQPGDVEVRAAAHRAAFGSTGMTPAAFRAVMQAPGYRADLDTVAASDSGIAAFALGWYDSENCVGEFEPVGTVPEFQGRGLGKAALCEGLRRFKRTGARHVIVYAEHDNPAAHALYRAVGFQPVNTIHSYVKTLCRA